MDQLGAMRTFIRVVQLGSFSAAGRDQNSSQATISKKIAALETRLGVKLLTRTSRQLSLTEAGIDYFDKCLTIIAEIDEADANARSQTASPRGILKVAAPIPFCRIVLARWIKSFTDQYPKIKIELVAGDKIIDFIAEGIDVAIRAHELEDSTLIARHLFENPMYMVASPEYLKEHGTPTKPEELKQHNCIVYSQLNSANVWHFTHKDKVISVRVKGSFQCNNGDTNLEAALAGVGITELPFWMISDHIKSGRLFLILADYKAKSIPFNIIYPQNRYVPLKVRCFVDFIKQKITENAAFI